MQKKSERKLNIIDITLKSRRMLKKKEKIKIKKTIIKNVLPVGIRMKAQNMSENVSPIKAKDLVPPVRRSIEMKKKYNLPKYDLKDLFENTPHFDAPLPNFSNQTNKNT